MNEQVQVIAEEKCFRCDYDLRGIADDQACPECGLLAGTSRAPSEQLRHTRPRWLRKLSLGIWCYLFALLITVAGNVAWVVLTEFIGPYMWWGISPLLALILFTSPTVIGLLLVCIASILITSAEGNESADKRDQLRRSFLRIVSIVPFLSFAWFAVEVNNSGRPTLLLNFPAALLPFMLALAILFYLVFTQLRSLAGRCRSQHVAEHCTILAWGGSASLAMSYLFLAMLSSPESFGLSDRWASRGTPSILAVLFVVVSIIVIWMWSLYVMIQFAVRFWREATALRIKWRQSDRAANSFGSN